MPFLKKNMLKIVLASITFILLSLSVYMIYNYKSTSSNSNFQSMGQQGAPSNNKVGAGGSAPTGQKPPNNSKNNTAPKSPNNNFDKKVGNASKDKNSNMTTPPQNQGNTMQQSGSGGMGMTSSSSSSSTKYSPAFIAYTILFFILFISILLLRVRKKIKISKENAPMLITGILVIGFLLRTASALLIDGHPFDINIYKGWANTAANNLLNVYANTSAVDYPPVYIYVLYIIGKLSKITLLGNYYVLLLKLPSIITDVLSGYMIYKVSKTRVSTEIGIILAAAYVFNPAVLINSTIWGQVDSFFTLIIILALYFLSEEKIIFSTIFFVLAVLMKPQGIIFLPILLFAYIKGRDIKSVVKSVISGIITALVVILPFSMTQGIMWIFKLYIRELSEYPYATNNAFNFYALIGANHTSESSTLFIFNYHVLGMLAIVLVTIFSGYIYIKGKDKSAIFIATLVEVVGVFNFSVGMHERYMFTAIAISILAYIYYKDKRLLILAALFTLTIYINTHDALFQQFNGVNIISYSPIVIFTSLISVLSFVYLAWVSIDIVVKNEIKNL